MTIAPVRRARRGWTPRAPRVLRHVGERLAGGEVERRLVRRGPADRPIARPDSTGSGRPIGDATGAPGRARARSASPGGCRGPARAAPRSAVASSASRRRVPRSSRRRRRPSGGQLQLQRERDEPLLGAVVQVALDAPPRRVGRLHDADAGLGQLAPRLGVGDRLADQLRERAQPQLRARRERPRRARSTARSSPRPGRRRRSAPRRRRGCRARAAARRCARSRSRRRSPPAPARPSGTPGPSRSPA